MNKPKATLNDVVGLRVRALRKIMGLSQIELAGKIDVTYQQLQKYERGLNNMNINMLERIGDALETSPADLIENNKADHPLSVVDSLIANQPEKKIQQRSLMAIDAKIIDRLSAIKDPVIHKNILKLIHSLVEAQENKEFE